MRVFEGQLHLSATDLSNFLGCHHRTALDLEAVAGRLKAPEPREDPLLDLLRARGMAHESAYVESLKAQGLRVEDLREGTIEERVNRTRAAIWNGVDVIVQGALQHGPWFGYPDILRCIGRDEYLRWGYEVEDTKLARHTRGATILQLSLYSDLLQWTQQPVVKAFHVVTPHGRHSYRRDAYFSYYRSVRDQMMELLFVPDEQRLAAHYPEPVEMCGMCKWWQHCRDRREADDHLSLVAGITRRQRRELVAHGVTTTAALAALPDPIPFTPESGSVDALRRASVQARLQRDSRGEEVPLWEMRSDTPPDDGAPVGLGRLPEPSPGDVFLDLEGDPLATLEGGREYLFGYVTIEDDGSPAYHPAWAFTAAEEHAAFERVMDAITDRLARYPGAHVYHYAPYEPAAFKRLMGRYGTRVEALDDLLRGERFVDLYAVVRQAMQVGVDRYSIKNLEPVYGYRREVDLRDANRMLRRMEYGLQLGMAHELPGEVRDAVLGYNRDDCVSTWALREWLEGVRRDAIAGGHAIPRPVPGQQEAPKPPDEQQQRVDALRARLLDGLAADPSTHGTDERARAILAWLLDWHRREDKATWWEYFRLRDLPDEDLLPEPRAVAGLAFTGVTQPVLGKNGRPTRSVIARYTWPAQEMEIRAGEELKLRDGAWGDVVAVDREGRTLDVKVGPSKLDLRPTSAFAHTYVDPGVMEGALLALGDEVAATGGSVTPGWALLRREPPRVPGFDASRTQHDPEAYLIGEAGEATEDPLDLAVRTVRAIDGGLFAIQGPPGAGKTFTAARMIRALVADGKRVGVTATSHKVIRNLLDAVHEDAAEQDAPIPRIAHRTGGDGAGDPSPHVATIADHGQAVAALADGSIDVLGGTAWLWARPEFANAVDVLFVDEAGQVALANAVAVSRAARALVLLGDPRQLEQPTKGTHPDGVGVSALEHLLAGAAVMPPGSGLFLPYTWRLALAQCAFTGPQFYEGRLRPKEHVKAQALANAGRFNTAGPMLELVEHDGNTNASDEEVERVELIVRELLGGATWVDPKGVERPIGSGDILVVSPWNAQVSRLAERLAPLGVAVGTVDKFQGQEAPVTIYSMATSRPEDAPRGMEFLYSLNRLNVATSRARCATILVASPALFRPECHSPRQMELANALCYYADVAKRVTEIRQRKEERDHNPEMPPPT